jgi:hypothetical protein
LSNGPFTASVLFRTVAGKRNQVIFANFVACSYVPEGFALVVYNIDVDTYALYVDGQLLGSGTGALAATDVQQIFRSKQP